MTSSSLPPIADITELPPPPAMAPTVSTSSMVLIFSVTSSASLQASSKLVPSDGVMVMDIWLLSISGINAVPLEREAMTLTTRSTTITSNTNTLRCSAFSRTPPYHSCTFISQGCCISFVFFSIPEDIIGTKVRGIQILSMEKLAEYIDAHPVDIDA